MHSSLKIRVIFARSVFMPDGSGGLYASVHEIPAGLPKLSIVPNPNPNDDPLEVEDIELHRSGVVIVWLPSEVVNRKDAIAIGLETDAQCASFLEEFTRGMVRIGRDYLEVSDDAWKLLQSS